MLLTDGNDYREIVDCLSNIGVFHFHDTSETAPIRRRCYIADNAFLRPDGGNLAAFLYALNHFTPEDIVTVTRAESQSNFTRQSGELLKEWLDDYSVGELWEKNLIGGTPSR